MERSIRRLCAGAAGGQGFTPPRQQRRPASPAQMAL